MGRKSLVFLLGLAFCSCTLSTYAMVEKQKIDWIQLTVEQKWSRATYNYDLAMICGIAYAKSLGKTPEDFGKFVGGLVALKWEGVDGIAEFVKLMHRNWQMWDSFEMEVLNETEVMFKARMRGMFMEARAKKWSESGVTADECIRFYGQVMKQITNHIGLNWVQKQEGDWIAISITEKK